ncbi:hypothetical protein P7C70_g3815, partial [Phenoliferia sp. Uapishka_3]
MSTNLKLLFHAKPALPCPSDSPQAPALSRKFSTKNLHVKTPRLPNLQHHTWFSNSPPPSPTGSSIKSTKRTSREARLEVSSPTMPKRGTNMEGELLDSGGERSHVRLVRSIDEAFAYTQGHGRTRSAPDGRNPNQKERESESRSTTPPPPPTPPKVARLSASSPLKPPRPAPTPPRGLSPAPCIPRSSLPQRFDSRDETTPLSWITLPIPNPPHPRDIVQQPPPRPHSPPSADILPLSIIPHHLRLANPSPAASAPFHASLIYPPSSSAVATGLDTLLVSLDVGGKHFVTSAQTLIREGRGGKLGIFVEEVVEEVRSAEACRARAERRLDSIGSVSVYPTSETGEEDDDSLISATHFDVSPYPSPFTYEQYDGISDDLAAALSLSRSSTLIMPSTPPSPIDPCNHQMFLHLPSRSTTPLKRDSSLQRIPPVTASMFPLPPHSPPHSPVKVGFGPRPLPLPPRPVSGYSQNSSSSYNPFEVVVVQRAQRLEIGKDGLEVSLEAEHLASDEEERRRTLRAVDMPPRIPGPREMPRKISFIRPTVTTYPTEVQSRPASREDEAEEDRMMEVFLDRDGDSFGAVLAFLRDGALPPHLSLPCTPPTPGRPVSIDPTTLALFALHPPSAFTLLAALRNLTTEAIWLGLDDLVETCENETKRVVQVVKWLEDRKRLDKEEEERKRKRDIWVTREKAGWI